MPILRALFFSIANFGISSGANAGDGRLINKGTISATGVSSAGSNSRNLISFGNTNSGAVHNEAGGVISLTEMNYNRNSYSSHSVIYSKTNNSTSVFTNDGQITLNMGISNDHQTDITGVNFEAINNIFTNSGTISATATRNNGHTGELNLTAAALGSVYGGAAVTNSGTITAINNTNNNGTTNVNGVSAYLNGGNFTNSGTISAYSSGSASGFAGSELRGGSKFHNESTGKIIGSSNATSDDATVYGVGFSGDYDRILNPNTLLHNDGEITAELTSTTGTNQKVFGLYSTRGLVLDAAIMNNGTISASGHNTAEVVGVHLGGFSGTTTSFENHGTIRAYHGNLADGRYGRAVSIAGGDGKTFYNRSAGRLIGGVSLTNTHFDNGGHWDMGLTQSTITGGNYAQDSLGTMRVAIENTTTYGSVDVGGTVTFTGPGQIDVDVRNAGNLAKGNVFAGVIKSTGGITAADGFTVTDNSHLFDFTATINGNNLDLSIPGGSTPPGGGGGSTGGGNPPSGGMTGAGAGAIAGTTIGRIANSLTVSGVASIAAPAATVLDVALSSNGQMMPKTISALGTLPTAESVAYAVGETLPLVGGNAHETISQGVLQVDAITSSYQDGSETGTSTGNIIAFGDGKAWAQAFGSWAEQDDRKGVSGYKSDTYGVVLGADAAVSDNMDFGLGFSYANSHVKGNSYLIQHKSDIDSYQLMSYGRYHAPSDYKFDYRVALGYHNNDGVRRITFMQPVPSIRADYNSFSAHVGGAVSRTIALSDSTSLTPSIRANYTWMRDQSYTETGHDELALHVQSNVSDSLIVGPEARVEHRVGKGTKLNLNLGLGYDVLDSNDTLSAAYVGAPGMVFVTPGLDSSPWMIRGGVGLSGEIGNDVEVGVRYDVESRNDFINHSALVNLRKSF